jgi:integrase
MHSEPTICNSNDLTVRTYVKTYVDGKRYRLYNGKPLGINCNPNYAKTLTERTKILTTLCYQLKKKLEQGWSPWDKIEEVETVKKHTVIEALQMLPKVINSEELSSYYERNLNQLYLHFLDFVKSNALGELGITELTASHVAPFLQKYRSTGTNYMNRRSTLSALFKRLIDLQLLKDNPIQSTGKMKKTAHRNLPYNRNQLKLVLEHLQKHHPELYLCSIMMYGCFLRPHMEIRLLKRSSFDESFSKIILGGKDNKSRRMRTVHMPDYVREELLRCKVDALNEGVNIFSKVITPYNECYFNTAWSRIKDELLKQGIISKDHTLYSFRHTAAVNMYNKTKDPYKIQQAFGHSSLNVTLTYLRNLGMVSNASLDDLPEL